MMKQNQPIVLAFVAIILVAGGFLWYHNIAKGRLDIQVRDPLQEWGSASHVYIQYNRIEVHRYYNYNDTGWLTVTENPKWIDLTTALEEPKTLGSKGFSPGKINLIRFDILNATVTVNGANYTATVINGKLNIVIPNGGVSINLAQTTTILLDITPKVTGSPNQGYKVTPAVKAYVIS